MKQKPEALIVQWCGIYTCFNTLIFLRIFPSGVWGKTDAGPPPSFIVGWKKKKYLILAGLLFQHTITLLQSLQNVIDSIPLLDQELKINSWIIKNNQSCWV